MLRKTQTFGILKHIKGGCQVRWQGVVKQGVVKQGVVEEEELPIKSA
jgi:hypothetical protein